MRSLLLLLLLSFSVPALAVYKCEFAGKLAYSDLPCKDGRMKELPIVTAPSDQGDAQQRLQQDKEKLAELEAQRHRQQVIDERRQQREWKARQAHDKKCAELAQRLKWANEDFARASLKSRDKAQLKAQRAHEKYQLACDD